MAVTGEVGAGRSRDHVRFPSESYWATEYFIGLALFFTAAVYLFLNASLS
jgi:hypothetical protein